MKLFSAASTILLAAASIADTSYAFVAPSSSSSVQHQRTPTTTSSLFSSSEFAENAITIASSISSLKGQTVVVKYGGNAMTTPELASLFCQDVATLQKLGLRIVVVHGGGPMINAMLEKVGVESRFEGGMRVSTAEVVDVAAMVLCGSVNKNISSGISQAGGHALGLSGRDDALLQCEKLWGGSGDAKIDLGNVGQVKVVNTDLINQLLDDGITPVIAPIGMGCKGEEDESVVYNINADVAAGRIAGELKAARVLFLTDIAGVLDKEMKLLKSLSCEDIDNLIGDGTITGGMIPKVTYATDAVKLGVQGAFITDGRVPHALLNEILAGGEKGLGSGEGGTVVTL
jgi:acetylglutamate kinase